MPLGIDKPGRVMEIGTVTTFTSKTGADAGDRTEAIDGEAKFAPRIYFNGRRLGCIKALIVLSTVFDL
jgi:hypothetical protein